MDNLPINVQEEEKAEYQQYDGFSTADEEMDALEGTLPLQSSDGLSIPVPPPPEGELSGKVGFSTPEKFEIVDICFRAYTTPANPSKSLKCSDFYPLFFAATPPAAWLSIAWIGRRIHRIHESGNSIRVSLHVENESHLNSSNNPHNPHSVTNNNNTGGHVDHLSSSGGSSGPPRKRKNAADQNANKRSKKEIMGVQLIDCLDSNHLSKEALQLKRICEEHNISFITSTNEDRVQIARSVIDLYYSVMRGGTRKIQLDLLEMLKVGLGYSRSIDLNALRDSVSLTCVASWRGSNLIDVAKNGCHPPFIVYNHDDVLTIEISTFHLKYTIDMERNILYIYFMVNEDEVVKASHFASGLLPIVGSNINPPKTGEKPERHQMVITIPPAFDEESLSINKNTEHVLTLSVKERSRPLRRRLAASNIGDNNDS